MKNFQQNLLIALALALCGLCAFQWHEQALQRNEITTMNGILYDKNVAIQDATNSIATLNHQVAQMDARITEIKSAAATNDALVVTQRVALAQLRFDNASLTNEIAQYKTAVDTFTVKLKEAYADIEKQNDTITNLVAQRDDFVKKFNDEVKDRNDVKYNDLVKQVQPQQGRRDKTMTPELQSSPSKGRRTQIRRTLGFWDALRYAFGRAAGKTPPAKTQ